jgi:hypothetical protein
MQSIQFDNKFRKYEAVVHGKYGGCMSPAGKAKSIEETRYIRKIRAQFELSPEVPAAMMLNALRKHKGISMENLLNSIGKGVTYKNICTDFALFSNLCFMYKSLGVNYEI